MVFIVVRDLVGLNISRVNISRKDCNYEKILLVLKVLMG